MQATLQSRDSRSELRFERRLGHTAAKVWRAITEPAHISKWFPSDMDIDLRLDGTIRFDFRNEEGPTLEGSIIEFDPPRVLAYTWGGDLLRFELRPEGTGCLLIFTYTFADRAGAASYAAGWQTCLEALDAALADQPFEPLADMNQLHQDYIEAFGMEAGSAEDTPEGWRVRFERQLTKPIAVVWAKLTAAHTPTIGGQAPQGFTTGNIAIGAITAVEAPTLLEYGWRSGDRSAGLVRWQLTDGTGHGARLILTQTGPGALAAERDAALATWQAHIEQLAKALLGKAAAASPDELGVLSPIEDGRPKA